MPAIPSATMPAKLTVRVMIALLIELVPFAVPGHEWPCPGS
jgi:hypothetical protein